MAMKSKPAVRASVGDRGRSQRSVAVLGMQMQGAAVPPRSGAVGSAAAPRGAASVSAAGSSFASAIVTFTSTPPGATLYMPSMHMPLCRRAAVRS